MVEHSFQVEGSAQLLAGQPEQFESQPPAAQQIGLPFPDLSGAGAAEREAHSLVFMQPMHRIQETWNFLNLINHYETVLGQTHLIDEQLRAREIAAILVREQEIHAECSRVRPGQERALARLPRTPKKEGLGSLGWESEKPWNKVKHGLSITCNSQVVNENNMRRLLHRSSKHNEEQLLLTANDSD